MDRLSTGFAISRPFRRLPLERERSRRPFINISRQRGALSPRERRERRAYQSAGSTEKSRRAAIIFNPALNIDADTWQEGTQRSTAEAESSESRLFQHERTIINRPIS